MPIYKHHYAEFLCFLIAVLCYKRLRNSAFIWFIPLMFLTFCMEMLATYLTHVKEVRNNSNVYNPLTTVSFIFYTWFVSQYLESKKIKKLIVPLLAVLLIASLANIYIINPGRFHIKTFIAGSLIVTASCFIYLYQSVKKYDIDFRIEKQPVFWIVIGLLFFYLAGAGFFIFITSFSQEFKEQFNEIIRWLSVFMYSCFSIAFILCPSPRMKY